MNILLIGADSFIGRNLKAVLESQNKHQIFEINTYEDGISLQKSIDDSDVIFHLLTVFRTQENRLFDEINVDFTAKIISCIGYEKKTLFFLSSTQVDKDTCYGQSKFRAEEIIKAWSIKTGNNAHIFRLGNEFGKWCPPHLNSVVATFCFDIARNNDICIDNPDYILNLMYIDDIVDSILRVFNNNSISQNILIEPIYKISVFELASIIRDFNNSISNHYIPNISKPLIKKLYSTFLSYLPIDTIGFPLKTHIDNRGSFTEAMHFGEMGQVSINVSKPGIIKGNHWHNTKVEKFLVISGNAVIQLREVSKNEIYNFFVSDKKMEIITIPPGYTHSITNTGLTDLITMIWANEVYDAEKPDTYFEEV